MDITTAGASAACDGFVDQLNSGYIIFHTSGDGLVGKCPMNNPAYGDATDGDASLITTVAVCTTATTAGTIEHAHHTKSDDELLSKLTCGVGTGEVQFSSLSYGDDETLTVTSLTVSWTDSAFT